MRNITQRLFSFTLLGAVAFLLYVTHNIPYAYAQNVPRRSSSETLSQQDVTHFTDKRDEQSNLSPAQQGPEISPALPIIELSNFYMNAVANSSSTSNSSLFKRDAEPCSVGSPCADGSCCSKQGTCGYGPDYCGVENCVSNCDALAMCGIYSEGGAIACGMNICCSHYGWCGTDDAHCLDADPNGLAPCQEGFGLCKIVDPPSCTAAARTSRYRSIGYYQASNVRDRLCNRISPSQIDATGYTHLNFAFAEIDPNTFQVIPANAADIPLYTEFTNLQNYYLQTWIAVGGFDFSDAGPSHTTWSNLTSSAANRATFISSMISFMAKYKFQGVDLDWEYPASPERGGERADMENYVLFVKEMREAFGTTYGISVTLAPDYWYLRGFDAISMQPYVDFFGFMAYDLHGSWDADIETLGALVRGQADIREIFNDTLPLWFDGLNPSYINFGLALYGRGYTLTNPECNQLLCPFSGPSKAGPCTNYPGVMSLVEIEAIILENYLVPELLPASMMKQISWGDQWIGYDDDDTMALKRAWADSMCFGGVMTWSVDFASGVGNGTVPAPNATTDGTCGKAHNGTVCGNWSTGNCCSPTGWCGSTAAYCGNGCQSGDCTIGGQTTDGSCGHYFLYSTCGTWSDGPCCSAGGYCGSTEAYCGTGCQSGPCLNTTSSGNSTDNSTSPCDPSLKFASLAALEAVANNYPVYCAEMYALNALSNELTTALANYTSVDNDYDGTFKYYVEYVKDMIPDALGDFMLDADKGPSFFECTLNVGGKNSTVGACPMLDEGGGSPISVYWTFTNETGFWAELLNIGILQDWVVQTPYGWPGSDCCNTYMCNPCSGKAAEWYNYPQPNPVLNITNPKDIITTSFTNATAMQNKISATYVDMLFGQWNGSALDAVQVLAMPVALLQTAISAMAEVKKIGNTEEHADKVNYVLGILTIVFAVVPFVGEESAIFFGLAGLGRIIALFGELGNIGLGAYAIDLDHRSAPMLIFGMLLGATSVARDPENMALMASLRKAMTTDEVAAMGKILVDQTAIIQKVVRACV